MSKDEFYKVLGVFKLGDSEVFRVVFYVRIDSLFCK